MKSEPLTLGVLGGANIARRALLPALQQVPELFRLAGVASRESSVSDEFAREFGGSCFTGYEELLAHPGLGAVYIPLPNALHAAWIDRALDHGLHVLVEKPFTCAAGQTARLVTKARERHRALVETFQFRFHPQYAVIRELLTAGRLGRIHLVRSSFGFSIDRNSRNVRLDRSLGGGSLWDVGVYPIKGATLLLEEELQLESASLLMDAEHHIDMAGAVSLLAPQSGVSVQAAFGFAHSFQCSLEIWGSAGRLFTDRFYTAGPNHQPKIHLQTSGGDEEISVPASNDFVGLLRYFHKLIVEPAAREAEFAEINRQARTLAAVFTGAKER